MFSEEESANLPAACPGEMKTDPLQDTLVDSTLDERRFEREMHAARSTVCMEGRSTRFTVSPTPAS